MNMMSHMNMRSALIFPRSPSIEVDGLITAVAAIGGRWRRMCAPPGSVALAQEQIAELGLAQRAPRIRQRVEHRLQIERRAADDLEHVGGGGLLLQTTRAAR